MVLYCVEIAQEFCELVACVQEAGENSPQVRLTGRMLLLRCSVGDPLNRGLRRAGGAIGRAICTGGQAMTDIAKTDWKIFKELREFALERFCSRVLDDIARIGSDQAKSKHERYLAIWRLIQERDREIDPIFDYVRRSTAVSQLCAFRVRELMTEEEFKSLSPGAVREDRQSHSDLQPAAGGRRRGDRRRE